MGKSGSKKKYAYLRLPLATPEEATARREHLIKVGTIIPELGRPEPTVDLAITWTATVGKIRNLP